MSIVIVGGNECMIRKYRELCEEYRFKAKIYPKMNNGMKNIGNPDLLVIFTNTMSHKMLRSVQSEIKRQKIQVERSHTSSMSALKNILQKHIEGVTDNV